MFGIFVSNPSEAQSYINRGKCFPKTLGVEYLLLRSSRILGGMIDVLRMCSSVLPTRVGRAMSD